MRSLSSVTTRGPTLVGEGDVRGAGGHEEKRGDGPTNQNKVNAVQRNGSEVR